ncbi:MAG: hypothetical protein D3917_01950 [Candidatus Electrothrix sp. AX5]|nr:hypothetical protein [Candidatus Electrothrix sp. AX5]
MDTEKTLLEEAEEGVCDLTRDEREFFRDIEEKETFRKISELDVPSKNLPTVRAKCLSWLLQKSCIFRKIDARSIIIIQGIHIDGNIDCANIILAKMLHFSGCYFSGRINLFHSELSSITFEYCIVIGDIYVQHASLKRAFSFISGSEARGRIFLAEAQIGGSVVFIGSIVGKESGALAINATGARIGGSVILQTSPNEYTEKQASTFKANGTVIFGGTIVQGIFECHEGMFNAPEGVALDLAGAKFAEYVTLTKCDFDGTVYMPCAYVGAHLTFNGSKFTGYENKENPRKIALHADNAQVKGNVRLFNCVSDGMIELRSVQVGAHLGFSGSEFTGSLGQALDADSIRVEGKVKFDNFKSVGGILFESAKVGGNFECQCGSFDIPSNVALSLDSSCINGHVALAHCEVNGRITISCATIGTHVTLSNLTVKKCSENALFADTIRVKGNFSLNNSRLDGLLSLKDARIGGILNCYQTVLSNKEKVSLQADRIQSKGIYLRNGFATDGGIEVVEAVIDGSLICTGGEFVNINAEDISVQGSVYLNTGSKGLFQSHGNVLLTNSDIHGSLICTGGKFVNLLAKNISVGSDICLDYDFTSKNVYLHNSNVSGSFRCTGGQIANLWAPNISVKGDVSLNSGFKSQEFVDLGSSYINGSLRCGKGEFVDLFISDTSIDGSVYLGGSYRQVQLINSKIHGSLSCVGGKFDNPGNSTIVAEHITAKNIFLDCYINGGIDFYGSEVKENFRNLKTIWRGSSWLSLCHVSATTLLEDKESWPSEGNLSLLGFTYEFIESRSGIESSILSAKNARKWLALVPKKPFHPQPYEQLANVLMKSGLEKESQEIQIEKNELLDRKERRKLIEMLEAEKECDACELSSEIFHTGCEIIRHPKPQIFKACSEFWDCIFYLLKRLLFRGAIGYGYRVKRLLPIFVYLLLSSSIFFHWGYSENQEQNIMTSAQKSLRSSKYVYSPDLPGKPEWSKNHTEENDPSLAQIISDDYPHFQPIVYSLDVIIPLVDLGQEEYWMPNHNKPWGECASYFVVFLKLSGWILSTLLVSASTGLIRR